MFNRRENVDFGRKFKILPAKLICRKFGKENTQNFVKKKDDYSCKTTPFFHLIHIASNKNSRAIFVCYHKNINKLEEIQQVVNINRLHRRHSKAKVLKKKKPQTHSPQQHFSLFQSNGVISFIFYLLFVVVQYSTVT